MRLTLYIEENSRPFSRQLLQNLAATASNRMPFLTFYIPIWDSVDFPSSAIQVSKGLIQNYVCLNAMYLKSKKKLKDFWTYKRHVKMKTDSEDDDDV